MGDVFPEIKRIVKRGDLLVKKGRHVESIDPDRSCRILVLGRVV